MKLKDKVIILTGASTGIGRALAMQLASEKCSLVLISRRKHLLLEIENDIKNASIAINTFECDVSDKKQVEKVFSEIMNRYGKVDIAILNAGVGNRASINDYSSEKAEETFGVNTFGIIYFVGQLLPQFIERKEGMIVGVSSGADSRGYPKSGFYNASKAAATIMLQSLRIELKQFNIKVLTVRPGFVKTPMTDKNEFYMPMMMKAEKAARIIIKGIIKEKKIIQFPLPIVLSEKLLQLLPTAVIEWLAGRPLPARRDKVKDK
jgi:short-subunit dehydrogenase